MKDTIQKFIFEEHDCRGTVVHLNESMLTVLNQHHYNPAVQQLLAETLISAVILMSMIKFDGELSLQFESDGYVKALVAKCSSDFKIKGLVQVDSEKLSGEGLLESGRLAVNLLTQKGQRQQSLLEIKGGSIVESLEHYFEQSEQLSTKIWLSNDENGISGLLLQKMPPSSGSVKSNQEQIFEHLTTLAATTRTDELLYDNNELLLHKLFHEEDVRLFDEQTISFYCNCSTDKMRNAVAMLGQEEAQAILAEKQFIEVVCEYCCQKHNFSRDDVDKLFH